MSKKIRVNLKSYNYKLVDESAEKIVKAVKATGAIISGPIPIHTRKQFQFQGYKRQIDIYSWTAKTVDALMKLELPSGVEIELKV